LGCKFIVWSIEALPILTRDPWVSSCCPSQVRHFVSNKLGVSERSVGMMTWAELLHKVVVVQQTTRLCVARWVGHRAAEQVASWLYKLASGQDASRWSCASHLYM
jgi:hypothetical protein